MLNLDIIKLILLLSTSICFILSACHTTELADEARPDILINYQYYEVTGPTANDLRTQMDQFGPLDESGNRHDAYTEWYVDWSYPHSIVNDHCTTGPINVTVTITYILPKWNIPPDAPPTLIDKWTTYLNTLEKHEEGHQQIAIDAGYEILRTLNALPAYPSCEDLEQAADAAGQKLLNQFRQKETVYDQTTNHGETQGSQFP
ncbi:DUF922 domain-containing Zn-dependent protease [Chloroflexota bacterium]